MLVEVVSWFGVASCLCTSCAWTELELSVLVVRALGSGEAGLGFVDLAVA